MHTDMALLSPDLTIDQARHLAAQSGAPTYLVGADHQLVGSVSFEQLEKARDSGMADRTLWSIVNHAFVHAHSDHPIDVVLERLAQSGGVLPIVSRADVHLLEGVVTVEGLLRDGGRTPAGGMDAVVKNR